MSALPLAPPSVLVFPTPLFSGRVLGTQDSVVWPREGEWWGAMDPSDPFGTVLPMNETRW